jgi:hypothetical protein
MLSVLLDPSVLFGLSVYLSPLFIAGDFTNPQALVCIVDRFIQATLANSWKIYRHVLLVCQIAYFTDPVSIIGVVALVVTLFATHKSGHNMPKLTSSDKRAALWYGCLWQAEVGDFHCLTQMCPRFCRYLVNGVVIHIMMDGLVGSFSAHNIFLPPMTLHYSILDKRFQRGDPNALVVTLTELLLMGPLCLFAYRARVLQRPYRAVLEAVVSALQYVCGVVSHVPSLRPHLP